MARRCDYTVDKMQVNSCVPKHLFLEGVEQSKISPKPPGNALSDALLMSRFQNFTADAARKMFFHQDVGCELFYDLDQHGERALLGDVYINDNRLHLHFFPASTPLTKVRSFVPVRVAA